jgi:two-component system, NtrC family, response regulator GlrR
MSVEGGHEFQGYDEFFFQAGGAKSPHRQARPPRPQKKNGRALERGRATCTKRDVQLLRMHPQAGGTDAPNRQNPPPPKPVPGPARGPLAASCVPTDLAAFGELVARSHTMKEVFSRLRRLAERDTTVFLEGESGTGKELAARAVHQASARRTKPFVVVDCSAIPRALIEAELFGHTKGAFTGAHQASAGKFAAANGGTIFLDEIGELDLDLQPRLLRVLERREVCPVGSTTPVPVDVRVISATNRTLRQEVRRGTFREDLFYRLAVASVRLPPLRDHREDIPILIDAFLNQHSVRDGQRHLMDDALIRQMTCQAWPGNVRELRNAVEAFVAFGEAPPLEGTAAANDLGRDRDGLDAGVNALGLFKEEKARIVNDFERGYLTDLLARHGNNISASALAAGLDRVHFLRLLDKHHLRARGSGRRSADQHR